MSHIRKQIRDAVIARLKTDVEAVSDRVFGNRARQVFPGELPCILVYTVQEPAEVSIEAPREYKRNLTLTIEILAKADNGIDDTLDALCETVEASIFSEETFGGLASDTLLADTDFDFFGEGDRLVGAAKITLNTPYYQRLPGDLSGPLDDLDTIHTDIDLPPVDEEFEATDDLDVST
jgi:hypothetical protein